MIAPQFYFFTKLQNNMLPFQGANYFLPFFTQGVAIGLGYVRLSAFS
jgi:hypothetical protein